MRLGVAFWDGVSLDDPQKTVDRLGTIGVRGAWLNAVEEGWSPDRIEGTRKAFDEAGIFVGAVASLHFGMATNPDEEVQRRGIEATRRCIADSVALGAHCISVHWRQNGAAGDWWSEDCWKRLVRNTAVVAGEAERLGIDLGFHSFKLCPWDTPEQHRRLADEVASPRVKVLIDVVNMIDHRGVYDSTDYLNRTFDRIGDLVVGAHAKDVTIEPQHWTLRIDEVPPGAGMLDHDTFLRRLSELDPDLVLTIEHLRDVGVAGTTAIPNYVYYPDTHREIIRAREFLQSVAGRIGIPLE
ncbi:MAG: sugar phosphate isomerase/epimerase [Gemmatimonadetes bacterium]|nr:sugar phosphate isomerase/epimerase [Gemmatimonadota bacterium]